MLFQRPGARAQVRQVALRGVAAGELVVTDGNFTLAHDTPVTLTEPEQR